MKLHRHAFHWHHNMEMLLLLWFPGAEGREQERRVIKWPTRCYSIQLLLDSLNLLI